jgi:hypothetical protein
MHVYEVKPRKDKRGVDLISDVLPFGRLWYREQHAISYLQLHLCFGILGGLAIPPWPRLRHAQTRGEEADTL